MMRALLIGALWCVLGVGYSILPPHGGQLRFVCGPRPPVPR